MNLSIANVCLSISVIASVDTAVAACKTQNYERESLSRQKRSSKNQDSLPLMKSTVASLDKAMKILAYPLKSSDDDFNGYDALIAEIESNLEKLGEMGVVLSDVSILFLDRNNVIVTAEQMGVIIKKLKEKIDEIMS